MKKCKKYLSIFIILLLSLTFVSCNLSSNSEISDEETITEESVAEDDSNTSNVTTDYYDEEIEGASYTTVNKNAKDFYGTWIATSEVAEYFYGNVTITIKKDGTWTGNVTDEKLSGKWKKSDDGLSLTSDLLDVTLSFTDNGSLVMQEDTGDGDYINTVLIKK